MVVVLAARCGSGGFPAPPPGVLRSAEAIAAGRAVYMRDCAVCHGIAGRGDGPQAWSLDPKPSGFDTLTGVRAEPGYWFFRIKEGGHAQPLARPGSAMPAWGVHLSDEQIWQVVAFLVSIGNADRVSPDPATSVS